MPEGPEIKVSAGELDRNLAGTILTRASILGGRYLTHGPPQKWDLLDQPLKILQVGNKGKLLYICLEQDICLLNTFGMAGHWTKRKKKHSDVFLEYRSASQDGCSDGSLHSIYFCDPRHFGTLKVIQGQKELEKKLSTLGPDMLCQDTDLELFQQRIQRRSGKTVPEVLMDQKIVCGIGNYIKSESLYRSRISPHRTVASLEASEIQALFEAVKLVMNSSYRAKGASIRDYHSIHGKKEGRYSYQFQVYNRKKDPQGNAIVRVKTPDKRTTHWVPNIQV